MKLSEKKSKKHMEFSICLFGVGGWSHKGNKPKMAYSHDLLKMAIIDYQGLSGMIKDDQGLSWYFKDYQGLSRSVKDHDGLTRTVKDCHGHGLAWTGMD